MRLSISNIAWDASEDEAMAELLNKLEINAIDVAPGKYFPNPAKTTDLAITRVLDWWSERGIEIIGMQALLFGTTDLNVFGLPETQNAMLKQLSEICRIGQGLGAKHLVFGSPKNRDRKNLNDNDASDVAVSFFSRLGDIAQMHNVVICLEPNPLCYGANFMTTSAETLQIVKQISHPAIKMQLDTGALTLNGENPAQVMNDCAYLISHIHASEPNLVPLGDGITNHNKIAPLLENILPNHTVAIEMLATKNEPHIVSIKRALNIAIQFYRSNRLAVKT